MNVSLTLARHMAITISIRRKTIKTVVVRLLLKKNHKISCEMDAAFFVRRCDNAEKYDKELPNYNLNVYSLKEKKNQP